MVNSSSASVVHVEQWQPQQQQSQQQQHQQQRRQQQQQQCGSSNRNCLWLLVHACGVVVEQLGWRLFCEHSGISFLVKQCGDSERAFFFAVLNIGGVNLH